MNAKKLLKISMRGEAWRCGIRYSGWCHAHISGELYPRYYSEKECPDSIVADLKTKGINTAEFEAAMERWVKTGQPQEVKE
jgi:hypothetical protein